MKQFLFENTAVLIIVPLAYYVFYRLFRKTWHTLDIASQAWHTQRIAQGKTDFRPLAVFGIAAIALAWISYYGDGCFYRKNIEPLIRHLDQKFPAWIRFSVYQEL